MEHTDLLTIQNELLEAIAARGGLKALVTILADRSNKPVIITDSSFGVLASSSNSGVQEREFVNFVPEESDAAMGMLLSVKGRTRSLIFTIHNSKKTIGFLLILEPDEKNSTLLTLGTQVALVASLELGRQNDLLALERSYKEAFIFDLLYGNTESSEEIIMRGEILGWNLQKPHSVIVFQIENYQHFSADKQLAAILNEIIETVLRELGEKAILMRKKGEVVMVLPMSKETRKEQQSYTKMLLSKVKALAEQKLPDRALRVGVGRNYDSPADIFRSYQEGKVALELGRVMSDYVSTPFFVELGLARILYNHDGQELKTFYSETLGELESYDISQSGELMDTLEKYLIYRCDLKETANALFLHPNTLRYRLKKIEEVLGVDLNEVDTKLNIMAALKIKYLKKLQ